jgi:hypothetical protein
MFFLIYSRKRGSKKEEIIIKSMKQTVKLFILIIKRKNVIKTTAKTHEIK